MSSEQEPVFFEAGPKTRRRRTHVITFGHPYSCTPILDRIFQFNPSPSHSQVTRIMHQTGLKRKQLTSWFWRKRKETLESEHSSSSSSSSSRLQQAAYRSHSLNHTRFDPLTGKNSSSLPKSIRSTKAKSQEDEEYCPPNHFKIHSSLNRRSSGHPTRFHPRLSDDQPSKTALVSDRDSVLKKDLSTLFQSDSQSENLPPPTDSASPDRAPLLIRCRLRPLAQRTLSGVLRVRQEDQNQSDRNDITPPSSVVATGYSPSATTGIAHTPPFKQSLPVTSELLRELDVCSTMVQGRELVSRQNGACAFSENHEPPSKYPQIENSNPSYSDHNQCYLDIDQIVQSQESVDSTAQIETRSCLSSDSQLSYPHSIDQTNSLSTRDSSIAFWNSPLDSTFSCTSGQIEPQESRDGVFLHVSSDELDCESNSQLSMISLGHEIHRWSELSDVDGASRYSSDSMESRVTCGTDVRLIDYSALLDSCSDRIIMNGLTPPSQHRSSPNTKESIEFEDGSAQRNYPVGQPRYLSHPYRPREHTISRTTSYKEHTMLPLPSSTFLLSQPSEVEEDPRLFVLERDYQELSSLLDWNPLF